jgi:putative DNA methylase
MTKTRKKLIEVALPLEAINTASAREKSIRHGHPSTLHLWWARRPLAAARAVIFAQLVDDPSSWPDLFPTEKKQDKERQRLFKIIEDLVQWENTTNEEVLQSARDAIWESWRRTCAENADQPQARDIFNRTVLPGFHDPFAGGGALPLEAQRLGLESYATDLNPIPILINKASLEVPPRFTNLRPVNPSAANFKDLVEREWVGAQGLAADVRHYGKWLHKKAEIQFGYLYPEVEITQSMTEGRPDLKQYLNRKLRVIAWLWARTVKSPNPAFSKVDVPLVSTYMLSTKSGKEAYLQPLVNGDSYTFTVRIGKPTNLESSRNGTKLSRGANFKCILSDFPITGDYIKAEGMAGRLGVKLIGMVADGDRGRVYLDPTRQQEEIALSANPDWRPEIEISGSTQYLGIKPYGMHTFDKLFTNRQLLALSSLSDLVSIARGECEKDAIAAGMSSDSTSLEDGGSGAKAYADAVALYLAFGVSKCADMCNTLCAWGPTDWRVRHLFARQAIPMTWDFAETCPLNDSAGAFYFGIEYLTKALDQFVLNVKPGFVYQADAQRQTWSKNKVISTDPPYYDNVPYADLSDFFYIWQRHSLKNILPNIFSTVAVPKREELVAFAYRHAAGKAGAEKFFLSGMTEAMRQIASQSHPAFPVSIYYAFKQSENDSEEGTTNTGWDTFLAAVIEAGFAISGTWPMRTELANRMRGSDSNALASSIVLVCRKRPSGAPTATRRDFLNALKTELPAALAHLQAGNIAPVDLAQAAIGPGMAVYTRFAKVLDAEGKPIVVRAALALINQVLDEALAEQEGDFDADTRWALAWFEQMGFDEGEYGVAEQLSKAKNTSVSGLVESGIVQSGRGKVKLLRPSALTDAWDPKTDQRLTTWETVHRLIQAQEATGENGAAAIVAKLGGKAETARELCYRLYSLCERKKRAADAMPYNALVQSWPEIVRLSQQSPQPTGPAGDLFSQE